MMLPFSLGHVYISMLLSIMARSRSASNSRSCWKQSEKTLRSLHPRAGSISYHELFNTLKQRAHNISVDCKRFLTAIAFEGVRDVCTTWSVRGGALKSQKHFRRARGNTWPPCVRRRVAPGMAAHQGALCVGHARRDHRCVLAMLMMKISREQSLGGRAEEPHKPTLIPPHWHMALPRRMQARAARLRVQCEPTR